MNITRFKMGIENGHKMQYEIRFKVTIDFSEIFFFSLSLFRFDVSEKNILTKIMIEFHVAVKWFETIERCLLFGCLPQSKKQQLLWMWVKRR